MMTRTISQKAGSVCLRFEGKISSVCAGGWATVAPAASTLPRVLAGHSFVRSFRDDHGIGRPRDAFEVLVVETAGAIREA